MRVRIDYVRATITVIVKQKMSVKDSLLDPDATTKHPDYRSVSLAVNSDAVSDRPGAGCVSFHNISYKVSHCFGLKKKKVILNSVR